METNQLLKATLSKKTPTTPRTYIEPSFENDVLLCVRNFRDKAYLYQDSETQPKISATTSEDQSKAIKSTFGSLPGIYPEWLGSRLFKEIHKTRFTYVCGAMANGISSVDLVSEAANNGLLAFFGAAGMSTKKVEEAIIALKETLDPAKLSWGSNLIHTPHEINWENKIVDLYLKYEVTRVSASAYMKLTPAVVYYACKGLYEERGVVKRRNHLFAKISRPEIATKFMRPAPIEILENLKSEGKLSDNEVKLAHLVPLSEDITVEADSAGHTDRQILTAIFPAIIELRRSIEEEFNYPRPIRLGAAGGIGSPAAAAAAYHMGADYILTGSINQSCKEAKISIQAKEKLQKVTFGDMTMCAASDMFEQGVKLQVLKNGSIYPLRANWLYEIYKKYNSLEELPLNVITRLEKEVFHEDLNNAWEKTKTFWQKRDSHQIKSAIKRPKHKMALLFRSYLGLSSQWAISGNKERAIDFQIWCGPAMANFNQWIKGSFLEQVSKRSVGNVALNLLEGACHISRARQLQSFGVDVPNIALQYKPQHLVLAKEV